MFRDFRELLDRPDIDAVLIATGPNWHATAAMTRPAPARTCIAKNPAPRTFLKACSSPTPCVAQAASFRPERSGGTCPLCVRLLAGPHGQARQTQTRLCTSGRHAARPAAGCPRRKSRPRKRSTGTCISAPRPGARTTPSCSTASTSRKGAAWSAEACLSGARTASTSVSGPSATTVGPPSSITRPRTDRSSTAMRTASTHLPRDGLAAPRFLPGAIRRRNRLGRDGRQRQNGPQLARAAGRPNNPRNRRLSGDIPRPRFPRLREVAQPAQRERRHGLLRAHRLSRDQHRPLPRPPAQNTISRRTNSSATRRPTAYVRGVPRTVANLDSPS